jgi:hypothetical protein
MNSDSAQTTKLSRRKVWEWVDENFPGDTNIFRIDLGLDRYTVWYYRLDDAGRIRTEKDRYGNAERLVAHEEIFYAP